MLGQAGADSMPTFPLSSWHAIRSTPSSRAVSICRRVVRPPRSLLSSCSPPPAPRGPVGRRALAGDVGLTAYARCIPPALVDVTRNPMHRALRRLRWIFPVRDAGVRGCYVVPGFVRKHFLFWNKATFQDQSLSGTWLSCLLNGVGGHVFLIGSRKAPPCDRPSFTIRFLEAVLC